MKSLPYREGSCFAVPLRKGGYGLGIVARLAPRGKIVLAYFFGPRLETLPSSSDVPELKADEAIKCLRVGDLGLMNGEWPVLGDLPHWRREDWPTPGFVRRDDLSKRTWLVHYKDADPSAIELEEPVPYEMSDLETSGLYGYGAVEVLLTKLLCN
jgi:hypothetical protein